MSLVIAPIVEGHGDFEAVPVLLRRLLPPEVRIARPVRCPRSKFSASLEFLRYVRIARANIQPAERGTILILIDADEDCPAQLGPQLLVAAQSAAVDARVLVSLAKREFECWLVGGLDSASVEDPESVGKPKHRLAELNGGRYKETADQAKFTARINIERLSQRSQSFRRLTMRLAALLSIENT